MTGPHQPLPIAQRSTQIRLQRLHPGHRQIILCSFWQTKTRDWQSLMFFLPVPTNISQRRYFRSDWSQEPVTVFFSPLSLYLRKKEKGTEGGERPSPVWWKQFSLWWHWEVGSLFWWPREARRLSEIRLWLLLLTHNSCSLHGAGGKDFIFLANNVIVQRQGLA